MRKQPYPENFTTMSSLYRRYRVNGVRVFGSFHGLTNTEDEKFWITAYGTTASDGSTDPWDGPTKIADRAARDAFLQFPGIRKKMIVDSGTTGAPRNPTFKAGYWSIADLMNMRRQDMDDDQHSGTVNADGTAVQDPLQVPRIWFRICSPRFAGWTQTRVYDLNLTLVFDVEWFDRREAQEPDQGETDA